MMSLVKGALRRRVFSVEGAEFVDRFSFYNRLYWKLPYELTWDAANGVYRATARDTTVSFARKERVWVYKRGVTERLDTLARIYMLRNVPLADGDWVIDCGSNIGEFSRCVGRKAQARIIAVEPEQGEARCIPLNVPGVTAVINKALWKTAGTIDFYSKNDSADSSIFEPEDYDRKFSLPATTLTEVFAQHGIDRLRLLKLEAEGAEPEILDGGGDLVERIDYISADVGPERGLAKETTLAQVANYLYSRGFELVSVNTPRLICLFRNRRAAGVGG
jgi:FkbM family methyltransferase